MKRIYKYRAEPPGVTFHLDMPKGAKIVAVGRQDDRISFWAEVDPLAGNECRYFIVVGTGWDLNDGHEYIGTIQDPPYVWHLVEEHFKVR